MRIFVISVVAALILAGCTSIPTEYTSPCACDYERISQPDDGVILA